MRKKESATTKKDRPDSAKKIHHMKMAGTILKAVPYSLEKWRNKLEDVSMKPSSSTISEWRNEVREMQHAYQEIFLRRLVNDAELAAYEDRIRFEIMKRLGIFEYQSVFYRLKKMKYADFLSYVFDSIWSEDIHDGQICWEKINTADVFEMLARKINTLYCYEGVFAQFPIPKEYHIDNGNTLLLLYSKTFHGQEKEYRVLVDLVVQQEIKAFCEKNAKSVPERLLHLLFLPHSIKDREYFEALKQHKMMPIPIDAYDIEQKEIYEVYITREMGSSRYEHYFLNSLTDAMMKKIFKVQHMILKEILSRNYDLERVNERYLLSNAGVWDYKYPVRRGLAFEKAILDDLLRDKGKENTKVLDFNLSGGLYGMRIRNKAARVHCADISPGCLNKVKEIVKRYDRKEEDDSMEYTLIRPDFFTVSKNESYAEQFDIIIVGLGGGSYIENLNVFLRTISQWLKKDGWILFSVYNKEALWWHSLGAENKDFLYDGKRFKHRGGGWELPVRLYGREEIWELVSAHFKIHTCQSYPAVLSVISDQQDLEVLDYVKQLDKRHARIKQKTGGFLEDSEEECFRGFPADRGIFHIIKASAMSQKGIIEYFQTIKDTVNRLGISCQVIEHEPIVSALSMVRQLNSLGNYVQKKFVKSVLLCDKKKKETYFFVLILLEKRISKKTIAAWYKEDQEKTLSQYQIRLLTEYELTQLQLASGSVSPFAFPIVEEILKGNIFLLYDAEIESISGNFLYTYSGSLKETWKIDKEKFLKFVKNQGGKRIRI